jgi:hypothetical protein
LKNRTDHPRGELAPVFRRAAQILQARGHGKGRYEGPGGAVCAIGALMAADGMDPAEDAPELDASRALTDAIWWLSPRITSNTVDCDPIERIADWNDAPERTAAEVVEELLAAARAIEERESSAVAPTAVVLGREVAA